jgi:hypothetical protein
MQISPLASEGTWNFMHIVCSVGNFGPARDKLVLNWACASSFTRLIQEQRKQLSLNISIMSTSKTVKPSCYVEVIRLTLLPPLVDVSSRSWHVSRKPLCWCFLSKYACQSYILILMLAKFVEISGVQWCSCLFQQHSSEMQRQFV